MKLLSAALLATAVTVLAAPAFAQGGSPYNRSGSQAGGPLGGMERRMGEPTPAPMAVRPMKRHRAYAPKTRHHRYRAH
ncbi:hypothetical protein [Methylobacterium oryzihabitans]|uniref:Uncharacterized protein n=1 Tax=Methylobacterium oryzihabitans TaxID=2499852 RepID=A0A3S2VD69_9HYPH|nr:hypothetical protein [Methylobacterium oryzihabitans]RVU20213.1 hypothetical protein EOE48_06295 [Methylobacterium oryzihabitans]